MDDFEPFLQIIHISDLHVIDPKSQSAVSLRGWIRILRKLVPQAVTTFLQDALAPHDSLAPSLFNDFLKEITVKDPVWSKCKTWLVDTGDLTTLGDSASLALGRKYLGEMGRVCPELASIYGNHDAWPGTFPLVAKRSAFNKQGTALKAHFTGAAPGLALRAPIPHAAGEVQLYFVDSIRSGRLANSLALGKVRNLQLSAFKSLVDQNYQPNRHDLRILAVHHPVHYPAPRPHVQMSMTNDRTVAKELDIPSPAGAYPLAHLILSGHTHFLFPEHGLLPSQPSLCLHPELGNDQCQFVVGTLMQLDVYNKRSGWPHQCEVLRLYYSVSDPSVLSMDRLLVARQAGANYRGTGLGPYKFVMVPGTENEIAEEITFNV
ncbi:MAG: metallophosphoesterase [Acidobacteriota bacterium]